MGQTNIFISYRRADTAGHTGRLYDDLMAHFGERVNVFLDLDGIAPGEDFAQAIQQAIVSCQIVLVMIGEHWTSLRDETGARRLDNPADVVRAEVASALLRRDVLLIPVLVGDARMPSKEELPPELLGLRRLNALRLSNYRWGNDTWHLITYLERVLQRLDAGQKIGVLTRLLRLWYARREKILSGVATAVIIAAVWGFWWFTSKYTIVSRPYLSALLARPLLQPSPPPPSSPTPPLHTPLNLLDAKNGGQIVEALSKEWGDVVDGKTDSSGLLQLQSSAVFAFHEQREATFDTFAVYIPGTQSYNLCEFELWAGRDSPTGAFEQIGRFKARNGYDPKSPFQTFTFKPVRARYFKLVIASNQGKTKEDLFVREIQLRGRLH